MTDRELREALLAYTEPAASREAETKERIRAALPRRQTHPWRRAATLAACLAVMVAFFALTPPGHAAAAFLQEQVTAFIETLFPPKEVPVVLEGFEERPVHEPHGEEPSAEKREPGFVLYVDEERYEIEETAETFVVRPHPVVVSREDAAAGMPALLEGLSPEEAEALIDQRVAELEAFYASLPPCDLTVRHLPDVPPETAAEEARASLPGEVSEIEESTAVPAGLWMSASEGTDWDSPQTDVWLVSDNQGGSYQITVRYYLEAIEGHGGRFRAMVGTFQVLAPEN